MFVGFGEGREEGWLGSREGWDEGKVGIKGRLG